MEGFGFFLFLSGIGTIGYITFHFLGYWGIASLGGIGAICLGLLLISGS